MRRIFLAAFLAALMLAFGASSQENNGFKMVVNSANPTSELSTKEISRMFFKRTQRWEGWEENGEKVRVIPINRETSAEVRKVFSKSIHKKSAAAIESYWQRLIFSGRDEPPEKRGSDADILSFVRTNRGAIGYVSSGADLGQGVKELKISDSG